MNRNISLQLVLCLLFLPAMIYGINEPAETHQENYSFVYKKLSTPNPLIETEALYRYLQNIFGEKILSGQMSSRWGINELEYILSVTGKQPAIRGIDFIHEKDNKMEVQNAIDWWKLGGIPTIMWHWGAPSKGEGYENSKKQIDINKCFIEGTPENKAMWEELKTKADHLEVLRDANVPILWRPFHELNGDWFWWGKQGPNSFKKLWQTMYNYFVHERKLNNLIWVLCFRDTPNANWYPGHSYVDIIGAGTYDGKSDPHLKMFSKASEIADDDITPIAYHECGTIPDPDDCIKTGAIWSWWMQWHTSHLSNIAIAELKNVYNHDLVVTLDEVPNIMQEYSTDVIKRKYSKGGNIPFTSLKGYNIGKKSKSNSILVSEKRIEIVVNGADFWGTKDDGYFTFNQINGDFDISVQVLGLSPAHLYTKAGIMARSDLSKSSKHVFFQVFPDNSPRNNNFGGCEFQYRAKKSQATKAIYPNPDSASSKYEVNFPNTWIRLTRKGNIFKSYISIDNINWHIYSRHQQNMPEILLVGLAVSSHNPDRKTKAEFSSFFITWER